MPRSLDDLEANALKFWPSNIAKMESKSSIIPKLIDSQEKFIGILYVADASPVAWKSVLNATSDMPGNLFLKHLMVLSDIGGEPLQRVYRDMDIIFPDGKMNYSWNNQKYTYCFKSLTTGDGWSNPKLRVDGPNLFKEIDINDKMEDVAMLLMYGGTAINPSVSEDLSLKCCIGSMLGKKTELDTFVRQRYILVSKITGGAKANKMGHLTQSYVRDRLQKNLAEWDFSKTRIPGVSQNEGATDMSFDIIAQSPSGRLCAIEVSFQFTTNSTIERKGGQAQSRQEILHKQGHSIAYVIDGAGNFQRRRFVNTICQFSDCTVTFRDDEIDKLARFIAEKE